MPYEGEFADKVSHSDIVKNPDVASFLEHCEYVKIPTDEEGQLLAAKYQTPPAIGQSTLPRHIFALDGSPHETSFDDRLPSTKLGYIKIGVLRIDLDEFGTLKAGRYVDPFRVAKLQDNNTALTFVFPSANIRWKGHDTVRDGFRAALDESLYDKRTRFKEDDSKTSLRTTLFHLASRRSGDMGTGDPNVLIIHRCPNGCDAKNIAVEDKPELQVCPNCEKPVYPSDCLRIHEEVNENQTNQAALNRSMNLLEALLSFHYLRYLYENSLESLSRIAVFIDGPLAIFGTSAWIHSTFMRYLREINQKLAQKNLSNVLIVGLQKGGQIAEHVKLIDKYISNNQILCLDDEYRYEFIAQRDPSASGFGSETYYGQDFIYKTPSGRTFVIGLPYPYSSKSERGLDFHKEKTRIENYPDLPRAIALVHHFESDLYENAIIPVALAHRYTAISLVPGGKVLDILTRQALDKV